MRDFTTHAKVAPEKPLAEYTIYADGKACQTCERLIKAFSKAARIKADTVSITDKDMNEVIIIKYGDLDE